jgi:uncharacterized protein YlxW (UPF0749 family)
MRRRSSRFALSAVLLLLGFLVVVQLRSQATDQALAGRSAQDLTVLVASLTSRNEALRAEIAALERQHQALADAAERGDTSAGQIRSDLDRVRAWSGALPVAGPGVRVRVDGSLPGDAIASVLNELRNAGAEAIAVGEVRVVAGVVVSGPAGGATIAGLAVPVPFEITAVGQPETLTGSLTRAGGPIAQLAAAHPDVLVTVTAADVLALPATDRDLVPTLGRPRL